MNIRKTILIILVLSFILNLNAFSQYIVSADIDANEYAVGNIVEVMVNVPDNAGFHGIYFDLVYDSSILEFDDIAEGGMPGDVGSEGRLLYAVSKNIDSRVIVAYSLYGNNTETTSTGELVKIFFRVKNQGEADTSYGFRFTNQGLIDGNNNAIDNVTWQDSHRFTIKSPYQGSFILIKNPYEYEVVYKDEIKVSLICSVGDFNVELKNLSNPDFQPVFLPIINGVVLDEKVALTYDFNIIQASLYDNNNNLLSRDMVKVYRSPDDQNVKIIDPPDHSLLNTDKVTVTVHSAFENVSINGKQAEYFGETIEKDRLYKVFKLDHWLKEGFNTITATAFVEMENEKPLTYKDTITVYYQKDDAIFGFVSPRADESLKSAPDAKLIIKGEIGSQYKIQDDPATGGYIENTVTLRVVYKPKNRYYEEITLVDNKPAVIAESDMGYSSPRARYIFYNNFDISLDKLDDGEILIIAYKNKEGDIYEDMIHRTIYIDNQRLWIDLVQPNVFTNDLLDTYAKMKKFNENRDFDNNNIEVGNDGSIGLKSTDTVVSCEGLKNVVDMLEKPDGTLYALVNNIGNDEMRIYKKHYGNTTWEVVASKDGVCGYDLCDINIGILIGVSGLFNPAASGLCLLREDTLIDLFFNNEIIRRVQFIDYTDGRVSIYGNNFDYLYSFNTYSIEESAGDLKVGDLTKISFDTNYNIKEFVLTKDGSTAVIRTDNDDIYFYKKTSNKYIKKDMPELVEDDNGEIKGKLIVCGEYENSDYNTYFIVKDGNNAEIIMENKEKAVFMRNAAAIDVLLGETEDPITFLGAGFKDNNFIFLYRKNSYYYETRGQVFFNAFYENDFIDNHVYECASGTIAESTYKLFAGIGGSLYTGYGESIQDIDLSGFHNQYTNTGSCNFNYVNDDVDGLTGFSFEIDSLWKEMDGAVEIGFSVKEKTGTMTDVNDPTVFSLERIPLYELLASADDTQYDDFRISVNYDDDKGSEIIHFEFTNLQENRYINFDIQLKSAGNATPSIYNVKVNKKIPAKIIAGPETEIYLPIHGYVYDKTVKEIYIGHNKVPLERDGSFYFDYKVHQTGEPDTIRMHCTNGAGIKAERCFTVELINSRNEVWDIEYKKGEENDYSLMQPDTDEIIINTTHTTISLKGKYYGLTGAFVGYELYRYIHNGSEGSFDMEPAKKGIFDLTPDENLLSELSETGPGFTAGYFFKDAIELIPGSQRLVIYCENPGGFRKEYMIKGTYPKIVYNMPDNEQEIIFNLPDLTDEVIEVNGLPVTNRVELDAYESGEGSYIFKNGCEISGYIHSLYSFSELNLVSFTQGLVFANQQQEITIPVQTGNRFTFKIHVELTEDDFIKDFYIGAHQLDQPLFSFLKKGIKVTVKKSFKNTNYIPDFSGIHPDNWTVEEKESLKIPLKLGFNRNDVPTKAVTMSKGCIEAQLSINYEHEVTGILYKDNGYYCLKDNNGDKKYLTGDMIKEGINRIQWKLTFRDFDDHPEGTPYLMADSYSGRPGMEDYIFEYHYDTFINPTVITFSENLTAHYYNQSTLPFLQITKDRATLITIILNDTIIREDDNDFTHLTDYSLVVPGIKEGRNDLAVMYKEPGKTEVSGNYIFKYDSKDPVVHIESYVFNDDYTQLLEITASITEANFLQGFLYYGDDIINRLPEPVITSGNTYQLTWKNLESHAIIPSDLFPVKIAVHDHGGKTGESELLKGFETIRRPGETDIKEVKIELNEYNGSPDLANESNYSGSDFPEHTKFAPAKFLKRVSIKDDIESGGNYLIKSGKPEKAGPVYWSRCESRDNIINNPEIKTEEIYTTAMGGRAYNGYFGNCWMTEIAGKAAAWETFSFNPLGAKESPDQGALSFWAQSYVPDNRNEHIKIEIYIGSLRVDLERHPGNGWSEGTYYGDCVKLFNNGSFIKYNSLAWNSWTHVYVIWDKNKKLDSNNNSIKIFINGKEFMTYAGDFDTSQPLRFSQRSWESNGYNVNCKVDNLKIWDYIVTDVPSIINTIGNDEDLKTTEDFFVPAYWSKCESWNNILDPEIMQDTPGIVHSNGGVLFINDSAQFGKASGLSSGGTTSHSARHIDLGVNSVNDYATASAWVNRSEHRGGNKEWIFNFTFNDNSDSTKIQTEIRIYNNTARAQIAANGSTIASTDIMWPEKTWMHFYVAVDRTGSRLSENKTVRMFFGGEEILTTEAPLPELSKCEMQMTVWSNDTNTIDMSVDNIKVWDHVVSEDPVWLNESEGNEDATQVDDAKGPVYWSKCEDENNFLHPEIKAENDPLIEKSGTYTYVTDPNGQFNNAFGYYHPQKSNGYITLYPLGKTGSSEKGTMSCYLKQLGGTNYKGESHIHIGCFYIDFYHGGENSKCRIRLNGSLDNIIYNSNRDFPTNKYCHVYVIWDSNTLSSGNTIEVYLDGALFLYSDKLDSTTFTRNTTLSLNSTWLSSHVSNRIDNLMIWDYVVSEDPNYIATTEETSSLPEDYGKYLVFKIAKDPFVNNLQTEEDINGKITFEAVGKKWVDGEIVDVFGTPNPLVIAPEKQTYIEGVNHLYYLVDADAVVTEFATAKEGLTAEGGALDPDSEDVIIDPGSLRINYYDEWTSFKPVDIYLVGFKDDTNALKDIIVYDPGYESTSLIGDYTNLHTDLRHPLYDETDPVRDRSFFHETGSESMTLSFWLRLEDEGVIDDNYAAKEKRILTFCNGVRDIAYLYYNRNIINFMDDSKTITQIKSLTTGRDAWNMVTLCIDKNERKIDIYVNDLLISSIESLPDSVCDQIVQQGARYYFGAPENEDYNTGFYSVALPFYIDRLLTEEEIKRLYNLYDKSTAGELSYTCNDALSDFGASHSDLHRIGGSDYFEDSENADYTQVPEYGSLKASTEQRNLLTVKEIDGKNFVVFETADTFISNNMAITADESCFSLTPKSGHNGAYYFGDKTGNYGLGADRWYSVTGYVEEIADTTEAFVVLRINSREQKLRLHKGSFHFVYDNGSPVTPRDVKLYIETDGYIKVSNAMVFNDGNYAIKETLQKTAASTTFPFDLSGTIAFWYKPLNANKDGCVNYETVIFDSEYIKIGTRLEDGDAVYYGTIKNEKGTSAIALSTHCKVTHRWQYIQVSYSCEDNVAYMYIDGKTAAKSENLELPVFGSLQGDELDEDNVYIGCDAGNHYFAQGYIDNIIISKYYNPDIYEANNPVSIRYNKDNQAIEREYASIKGILITPEDITGLLYRLESYDKDYYIEGESPDITKIPAGRFRLTASMKVKGHNYKDIITFNNDTKPTFELIEKTPIIFSSGLTRVTSEVSFTLMHDDSYRCESEALEYSGAAIRIQYNNSESEIKYLVQDYQNQNKSQWLVGTVTGHPTGSIEWTELVPDTAGLLKIYFKDITATTDMRCEFEYFYFTDTFQNENRFASIDLEAVIALAGINYSKEKYDMVFVNDNGQEEIRSYEYKLNVSIIDHHFPDDSSADNAMSGFPDNIRIGYTIDDSDTVLVGSGRVKFDNNGIAELFYDDILPAYDDDPYTCTLTLYYNDADYARIEGIPLTWKEIEDNGYTSIDTSRLELEEFSVLYVDKEKDLAGFYLHYRANNIGEIVSTIDVIQNGEIYGTSHEKPLLMINTREMYNNIPVPKGAFKVRMTLQAGGFICSEEVEVHNVIGAPEVLITNGVETNIEYNNVLFSWKGYYEGVFNEDIEYSYNFDNSGWSTPNSQWRSVRFYNLDEGNHRFIVQALYNGIKSDPKSVPFFVDVKRPVFNAEKIEVINLYDNDGVFYGVTIKGARGAITDASLQKLYINGKEIDCDRYGAFVAGNIILTKDGINKIRLTAIDKVGNFKDFTINVDNTITSLIYPDLTRNVTYCPMTIVGKINDAINAGMTIYIRDPFCTDMTEGDYSGWKKAKINEDRIFFVEDVFINPGSAARELLTTLKLAVVFDSGKTFEREIDVRANGIITPIELTLSTHAAEGENSDTYVDISCRTNVENIASWSIDFDGDGVYDLIDVVNNPDLAESKIHEWDHKYSSLGIVKPRVRIITTDGNYFSVSDNLIIHEKIKEASNKIVNNPLSLSILSMPDGDKRIFVLREKATDDGSEFLIEVYEVGRNETYISNKLYSINITELGIKNPVRVRAYNETNLFVGANSNGAGIIYQLTENEFGNLEIVRQAALPGMIRDMDSDIYNLFVSFEVRNSYVKIPMTDTVLDIDNMEEITPELPDSGQLGGNTDIAKDEMGLCVADYYNQRIVRLTNSLSPHSQFGHIGDGEKEFIKPAIITSYQNRIFVFDEARKDIQVFDHLLNTVCVLEYSLEPDYHNYLDPEFFNDVADIAVITKEENNRLYYYALILSKSTGQLSMLRLPQWEELRAKVRNNKIVFIQDGEIFTAKPDGGDLKKILSSDSIPRIEGSLDYPALSPDGKTLVFTSKMRLYSGEYVEEEHSDNRHAYDDVYCVDIETKEITKIDLGEFNSYEIERPVFNSNGDKLIFSAKETGSNWQIYEYSFETQLTDTLFDSEENVRFPYYSPDDRFVVFTTDYDGNEGIEIIDTKNTSMRVRVTSNSARNSFPVWNTVYPFEVDNKKIESKIAFVSERDFHKGIYYVYLLRESEFDIRVVTHTGGEIGNDPDSAAIEITNDTVEGDYPCFSGDGQALVFEYFDGEKEVLKKCDYIENFGHNVNDTLARLNGEMDFMLRDMELPGSAHSPAGMKNMITHFKAENRNGDEIRLTWNRYTESDTIYFVYFKKNRENEIPTEKKIFSQDGTELKGLEMGQEYLVKVCIKENEEEVATSLWKKVKIPPVVARPTVTIDKENPYLVHLHAWKPEFDENDTPWNFSWMIDNQEITVQDAEDYPYEFATSGEKTIILKAYTKNHDSTDYSPPVEIKIISDIEPIIEYVLAEDSASITLSVLNSLGNKIDTAKTEWAVTGTGNQQPITRTGSYTNVDLTGFKYKIFVNLKMYRIPINGQAATDVIEKNMVIDLDYKEVKPVITESVDEINNRLFTFSGEQSKGNIDWYRAQWTLFADNGIIREVDGKSTFQYLFPETNRDTVYSVSLTLPRRNDGMTETVSKIVCVEATPIEPAIDYQIMTIMDGENVVGAKLLLDCTKSMGSHIDFAQARWSVPIAGGYGEEPTQFGPTALYNLIGADKEIVIEVALTLSRRGGIDPLPPFTKMINLSPLELPESKLVVTRTLEESTEGKTLILDVLKSTGPNIDWEKTDWSIDGQPYDKKGPAARIDIPASGEKKEINYVCTLYRYGADPQVEKGTVKINKTSIIPLISYRRLSPTQNNVYELSILDTKGVNIDWERTDWFIYDGNENVIQKRGAKIAHAFAFNSAQMGYPVMVEVYLKGSSLPYVNYTTIDIVGDELIPVITYDSVGDDPNTITFSAVTSKGSNIDWSYAKWTFGDSSPGQFGSVVSNSYKISTTNRTYRVTLTLTRKSVNGSMETKTVYKDITIGKDKIKPKIRAKLYGDGYLVLSAEKSEGRGLLLDRSLWLFEGKGDNETIRKTEQTGVVAKDTFSLNVKAGVEAGISFGCGPYVKVYAEAGFGYVKEVTSYLGYGSSDYSFSSSNIHNGAICRKFVGDLLPDIPGVPKTPPMSSNPVKPLADMFPGLIDKSIVVTLFVYRMTPEGGITGESITVNIDFDDAKGGKTYE
ncbi:MAG: PD40 domain-containing protein [Spirochaetales bacterium]|nr:PD40 domain-containing protein [Spirochaetales bacterium]